MEAVVMKPCFPKLDFQPMVHGLRATAVTAVVLFHFDCGLSGGYVGVDVFFVLSGYLISRNILHEIEQNSFSMIHFWNKRVHRLQPALMALVCIVLMFSSALHKYFGFDLNAMHSETRYVLLFCANLKFYGMDSYFDNPEDHIFLHCWSLAVEEQFYVLYPVLLLLCWNVCLKINVSVHLQTFLVFACLLFVFCVSLSVSVESFNSNVNFGFYMLPARAWEMLIGAFVAFPVPALPHNRITMLTVNGIQCCGLLSVFISILTYNRATPFPSYRAVLPCVGTAAIIVGERFLGQRQSFALVSRALSTAWLVYLGELSYSIYLWHWPVFVFMFAHAQGHFSCVYKACGILSSVLLGTFSLHWIENPFRTTSKLSEKWFWIGILSVWLSCFFYLNPYTWQTMNGYEQAVSLKNNHTVCAIVEILRGQCVHVQPEMVVDWGRVTLDTISSSPASHSQHRMFKASPDWLRPYTSGVEEGCQRPHLVMLGSSKCLMLLEMVERMTKAAKLCYASLCVHIAIEKFNGFEKEPQARTFDSQRLSFLSEWKPDVVVWADVWSEYARVGRISRSWKDTRLTEFMEHNFRLLLKHTQRLVLWGDIPRIATGSRVSFRKTSLVRVVSSHHRHEGNQYLRHMKAESRPESQRIVVEEAILHVVTRIREDDHQGAFFVPVADWFATNSSLNSFVLVVDPCTFMLLFRDPSHLNAIGAERLAPLFAVHVFNQLAC
mmetsp:Transcript_32178/g.75551  ORF Transcript_32178/g.75551 Transcript_32178/m.75551 type:complete len:720 (+) Transcript_32178:89-2248(+)